MRPVNNGTRLCAMSVLAAGLIVLISSATSVGQHGVGSEWGPERQISGSDDNASWGVGRPIAVDGAGTVHAVWHTVNEWKIYYVRSNDQGATWTTPEILSTGSLPASGANIASGPDNGLHVVWQQRVEGGETRAFYTRLSPQTTDWETPRDISGALSLDVIGTNISIDLSNRAHVAWHIGDAGLDPPYDPEEATRVYYARSLDGGDTFETPRQISSETGYHAAWPRFSVAGTSGQIVALTWRDNRRDVDWDVYAAVSTDAGQTFTEYAAAATTEEREWDPEILVDADGVIHLTYTLPAGGFLGDVVYRRSTDLGKSWSEQFQLSDEFSFFTWVGHDPETGILWVMWKDERDEVFPELKADLMLRYSFDGGVTWSQSEFATDLGDLDTRFANLTVGADGAVYVVWADLRNGIDFSTVFLRRRDPVQIPDPPTAVAGGDEIICGNGTVEMNGQATDSSGCTWTTSGDGAFEDAGQLDAVYSPGAKDITTGGVTLTLTCEPIALGSDNASDSMEMTIQALPMADAGMDQAIGESDTVRLNGATENSAGCEWESLGDGSFNDPSELAGDYTPGPNDIADGSVPLRLQCAPIAPCTAESDDVMIVTITAFPESSNGPPGPPPSGGLMDSPEGPVPMTSSCGGICGTVGIIEIMTSCVLLRFLSRSRPGRRHRERIGGGT